MTGHQPIPETCGCPLIGGQMLQVFTCEACAGSMRQWCGSCVDGMVYRQCPHGARSTSSYPLSGAAPGGSGGSGGFNDGRDGRCGQHGGWAPTSHGHGRAA
ncbi:hypothetical protein NEUTE1DRAFT_119490 [Neurospora tetrasperma FGSC 2508]|uniref:Uncharacterized protein n=1 Tax=Neurospora tetrasperma (strain FGSC 2508 / ATCC MYA-4615 / P0657) TaxID=510951 RepID=F8MBG5_NEUT8|nr:uncharacterized protein NEUTE1DRAFT_119490 [Neurospora tetrasperma FGSC 2508]EGO60277.1 hypothetical protein NEUTE1DRAFT_119490 [Neurospora tetrasperma FGSC 2508]EGZ75759.1 hypothetical protein NEUTE2DRAFT_105926 [Neurospora tetrasperma FGSC 2509]